MIRANLRTVALLLAATVAGCVQFVPRDPAHFKVADADFGLIAAAALRLVERTRPVTTIVIGADLDPRALIALRRLRPLARRADVPRTPELALPGGYFVVEAFGIDEDEALFEGQLGPVTREAEGKNVPGCGLRFAVAFYWELTSWANHSCKILDCAKTRSWTPID